MSLERLFGHTMWLDANPEIDKLLASATRQDELFARHSLTGSYVLTGNP
jgi:hypothetical protein